VYSAPSEWYFDEYVLPRLRRGFPAKWRDEVKSASLDGVLTLRRFANRHSLLPYFASSLEFLGAPPSEGESSASGRAVRRTRASSRGSAVAVPGEKGIAVERLRVYEDIGECVYGTDYVEESITVAQALEELRKFKSTTCNRGGSELHSSVRHFYETDSRFHDPEAVLEIAGRVHEYLRGLGYRSVRTEMEIETWGIVDLVLHHASSNSYAVLDHKRTSSDHYSDKFPQVIHYMIAIRAQWNLPVTHAIVVLYQPHVALLLSLDLGEELSQDAPVKSELQRDIPDAPVGKRTGGKCRKDAWGEKKAVDDVDARGDRTAETMHFADTTPDIQEDVTSSTTTSARTYSIASKTNSSHANLRRNSLDVPPSRFGVAPSMPKAKYEARVASARTGSSVNFGNLPESFISAYGRPPVHDYMTLVAKKVASVVVSLETTCTASASIRAAIPEDATSDNAGDGATAHARKRSDITSQWSDATLLLPSVRRRVETLIMDTCRRILEGGRVLVKDVPTEVLQFSEWARRVQTPKEWRLAEWLASDDITDLYAPLSGSSARALIIFERTIKNKTIPKAAEDVRVALTSFQCVLLLTTGPIGFAFYSSSDTSLRRNRQRAASKSITFRAKASIDLTSERPDERGNWRARDLTRNLRRGH
jgi:hypothetical protein